MPWFCRCPNCNKKLEIRNFLIDIERVKEKYPALKGIPGDKALKFHLAADKVKYNDADMICSCGAKFKVGQQFPGGWYYMTKFWEE
jgi:hypothetical protein